MTTNFREDYVSPHTDPLDSVECDFDWAGLYKALGEDELEIGERDYESLAYAVKAIMLWVLKFPHTQPCGERAIARRFLTLVWTINPDIIRESPSLSKIARDLRCHKQTLSIYAAKAHREFGICNRSQKHGWNFKAAKDKSSKGKAHQ